MFIIIFIIIIYLFLRTLPNSFYYVTPQYLNKSPRVRLKVGPSIKNESASCCLSRLLFFIFLFLHSFFLYFYISIFHLFFPLLLPFFYLFSLSTHIFLPSQRQVSRFSSPCSFMPSVKFAWHIHWRPLFLHRNALQCSFSCLLAGHFVCQLQ